MTKLWRMSASELAPLVRSRKVSAREITEDALARLAQVNPSINAVVSEFPEEALETAEQIDKQLARGEGVGPLAAICVSPCM